MKKILFFLLVWQTTVYGEEARFGFQHHLIRIEIVVHDGSFVWDVIGFQKDSSGVYLVLNSVVTIEVIYSGNPNDLTVDGMNINDFLDSYKELYIKKLLFESWSSFLNEIFEYPSCFERTNKDVSSTNFDSNIQCLPVGSFSMGADNDPTKLIIEFVKGRYDLNANEVFTRKTAPYGWLVDRHDFFKMLDDQYLYDFIDKIRDDRRKGIMSYYPYDFIPDPIPDPIYDSITNCVDGKGRSDKIHSCQICSNSHFRSGHDLLDHYSKKHPWFTQRVFDIKSKNKRSARNSITPD